MGNMNNVPAYGLWGLVIINSLIFIIFVDILAIISFLNVLSTQSPH